MIINLHVTVLPPRCRAARVKVTLSSSTLQPVDHDDDDDDDDDNDDDDDDDDDDDYDDIQEIKTIL